MHILAKMSKKDYDLDVSQNIFYPKNSLCNVLIISTLLVK